MGTLFDITAEFTQLYELATDPECDEELFQGTLEALTGELEVKASGYTNVIKQLEMEAKQADEISKAFADKKKVRENHIKRMKEALKYAMETAGLEKIDAEPFTIKIQKNGGLQPLKIDGDVPGEMMRVIYEPDTDRIREFLKENECDWAHFEERGTHIVIK